MRPSRNRLRLELLALEERAVPSHSGLALGHGAVVRTGAHHVQRSSSSSSIASQQSFPLDVSASLQAGITVNEQWTTSYNNGTTQTESRLIVPTVQFSGVTTTRNMSLPAGAGRERVIEVVTTAANTTDIDTTTTLPDGSVQSSNESLIQTGNKTTFNKTTHLPGDGGFELIQGQTIANGTTSTTDETIHSPDGTVSQDHIVVTHRGPVEITDETLSAPHAPAGHIHTVVVHHGELNQTRTTTTTQPGTARQVVKSTTVVFRLPPN